MQWSLRVIALYICVFTPVTLVTAEKCDTCKDMVQKFHEGLKKTAKSNFGGGNTRWEEERLGSFAFSETRFVEIQETLCSKSSSECNAMLEEHEETLEDWWFKQYAKNTGVELHQYFCIDNVKVCCPNNTYGPKCLECPGGTERPCQGRGSCDGAGTREGKGTCKCDWGYQGELCDDCKDGFFEQARNDTTVTCSSCHKSCKKTCTEAGATGCDECKEGWESDEEVGCKDIDECAAETSPCSDNEYCSNNEGSYACKDCHISCKGCTGSGSENCVECNEGFTRGDKDNCFDIDECTEGAQCTGENEKCVNEPGTYKCECEEGFIKQDDKCVLKPRDHIMLYKDSKFNGDVRYLSESVPDLAEEDFDDVTSSIKVFGKASWKFYKNKDYKGKFIELTPGDHDLSDLSHVGNDHISSALKLDVVEEEELEEGDGETPEDYPAEVETQQDDGEAAAAMDADEENTTGHSEL